MVLSALDRNIFGINSAIHQTLQWLDKYKPLTSRASSFVIVHWPKSPYSSSKSVVLHPKHSLIAGKCIDEVNCSRSNWLLLSSKRPNILKNCHFLPSKNFPTRQNIPYFPCWVSDETPCWKLWLKWLNTINADLWIVGHISLCSCWEIN